MRQHLVVSPPGTGPLCHKAVAMGCEAILEEKLVVTAATVFQEA